MVSSRVVLSRFGWSAIVGGMGSLLLALVTLNLLLLLVPVAVLGLVLSEILAFDWGTRGFGPGWFRWQRRENSSELPIDGVGSMAVDLEMVGPRSIYAEVFDPQPGMFEVAAGSPRLLTWWPAAAPVRLAYVYRPRERGRFRIGPTLVVAHDPLGLAFRIAKLENRWEVLVTPALSVEEAAKIVPLGPRGASEAFQPRVGSGTEFRSLREYQSSDDARKIAWRRSGLDKVYVREHEEESHPEVLVLLDVSRGMRLGLPGRECLEQGIIGGTVLAGQALRRSDRVALMGFADRAVEYVAPQRGADGAELLTRAFARLRLVPEPFDLVAALAAVADRVTVPTTVVLFSTLLCPPESIEGPVRGLRTRGHRLVVLCPDVGSLFPPADDPLAARTLEFGLAPVRHRVEAGMERVRRAGGIVVPFGADEVGSVAAAVHEWLRRGGPTG